jgi:putative FmdB family regulatory protein
MPIYEYRCGKCRLKFSELVRGPNKTEHPACPKCGSLSTERVMSTFAYHRSVQDIHESSGEPSVLSDPSFYADPRNIGRFTEKKFAEMGMDVPPEVRESIEAARDGQLPAELEE